MMRICKLVSAGFWYVVIWISCCFYSVFVADFLLTLVFLFIYILYVYSAGGLFCLKFKLFLLIGSDVFVAILVTYLEIFVESIEEFFCCCFDANEKGDKGTHSDWLARIGGQLLVQILWSTEWSFEQSKQKFGFVEPWGGGCTYHHACRILIWTICLLNAKHPHTNPATIEAPLSMKKTNGAQFFVRRSLRAKNRTLAYQELRTKE